MGVKHSKNKYLTNLIPTVDSINKGQAINISKKKSKKKSKSNKNIVESNANHHQPLMFQIGNGLDINGTEGGESLLRRSDSNSMAGFSGGNINSSGGYTNVDLMGSMDGMVIIGKNRYEIFDLNGLPEVVLRKIVSLAGGAVYPSKHFSRVSAVCRTWWQHAFYGIRGIYYHYPHIYENTGQIKKVKILARWLSPNNHYGLNNNIGAINIGFGIDATGLNIIFHHLLESKTLRSVRVTFYQKIVNVERIACITRLITENSNIRKLDLSSNKVTNRGFGTISQLFANNVTNLKELVWRQSNMNTENFVAMLDAITSGSQVTHINFGNNYIELDEYIDQVCDMLSRPSCNLLSINLSSNLLSFHSISRLIHAVSLIPKFQRLVVDGNQVDNDQLSVLQTMICDLKPVHHHNNNNFNINNFTNSTLKVII